MESRLFFITVVYRDDANLEQTYESVHAGYSAPYVHYIFAKQHDPHLAVKYSRSTVVASHDSGIYNAMNLAFASLAGGIAASDRVLFLNSGDVIHSGELERLVRRFHQSRAVMALGAVRLTRDGAQIGVRMVGSTASSPGRTIFFDYPCHQSTVYSAKALLDVYCSRGHLYDESYKVCADLDLYLLLSPQGVLLGDSIVADYDTSGYSDKAILQTAAEKMRLVRRYENHSRWLAYAMYWRAKARCVFLKRAVLGRP